MKGQAMSGNPFSDLARMKRDLTSKKKSLEKELREIEAQLSKIEKMENDAAKLLQANNSTLTPPSSTSSGGSSGGRSGEVIAATREILTGAEKPISRSDLVDLLEARGVKFTGTKAAAANYVGTTLFRKPEIFVNLSGFGYWLRARSYAPANHFVDNESNTVEDTQGDNFQSLH